MRVKFKCSLFGKTLCLWHLLYFLFLFIYFFFSVFFIVSMNCTRYSIAAYFELFGSKWRNVRFRSELNWNENLTFLIHFNPMFHFYTPWKRQKTKGYLTFSGGMKMECFSRKILLVLFQLNDTPFTETDKRRKIRARMREIRNAKIGNTYFKKC